MQILRGWWVTPKWKEARRLLRLQYGGRWRQWRPGDALACLKQRRDKLAVRLYRGKGRNSWLTQQCGALLQLHGFRLSLLPAFGLSVLQNAMVITF